MKRTPKNIVDNKPFTASLRLPNNKALWANVTHKPELNKITVLAKGIATGSSFSILKLGHIPPVNIDGIKLKWK